MSNGTEGFNNLAPGGPELAQPGASPCDQGEQKDVIVRVQQGQSVNLLVKLCDSPFSVKVFRDQELIFDVENQTDEVTMPVTGLTPGNHSLTVNFLAAASPWKTRSEVFVDGNLEFRRKEQGNSSNPFGQIAVFLQVT